MFSTKYQNSSLESQARLDTAQSSSWQVAFKCPAHFDRLSVDDASFFVEYRCFSVVDEQVNQSHPNWRNAS